eukprot:Seg1112.2 transcript_id=Seg1112.2/GoldUCD/mRNA.D3Y31 product="hypothetical protein" protein_id=Seg1112.2/GoldUCD/D3Y31
MAANVRGIAKRSGFILDVIGAARKTKVAQGMKHSRTLLKTESSLCKEQFNQLNFQQRHLRTIGSSALYNKFINAVEQCDGTTTAVGEDDDCEGACEEPYPPF